MEQQPQSPENEAEATGIVLAAAEQAVEPPEHERRPPDPPSIYVASLADYNEGKLHGAWVDMTMPLEDIELAIRQMLERSPVLQAEGEAYGDWAIHDSENFGVATVHEHDDLDTLHELAAGIGEHGEAFSAWAEANEGDIERWPLFAEVYLGEFESLKAYGEHLVDEMGWQRVVDGVLPDEIARYTPVDADHLAQDLWLGGDIQIMQKPGGGCWIFRGEV